jgi:hypothetical protein
MPASIKIIVAVTCPCSKAFPPGLFGTSPQAQTWGCLAVCVSPQGANRSTSRDSRQKLPLSMSMDALSSRGERDSLPSVGESVLWSLVASSKKFSSYVGPTGDGDSILWWFRQLETVGQTRQIVWIFWRKKFIFSLWIFVEVGLSPWTPKSDIHSSPTIKIGQL